jgi:hypothetical protein
MEGKAGELGTLMDMTLLWMFWEEAEASEKKRNKNFSNTQIGRNKKIFNFKYSNWEAELLAKKRRIRKF